MSIINFKTFKDLNISAHLLITIATVTIPVIYSAYQWKESIKDNFVETNKMILRLTYDCKYAHERYEVENRELKQQLSIDEKALSEIQNEVKDGQ
jgi:hypothetical protein